MMTTLEQKCPIEVTIIPMGESGVKHPNKWFQISMTGAKISREAEREAAKHLPTKRSDLCKTK